MPRRWNPRPERPRTGLPTCPSRLQTRWARQAMTKQRAPRCAMARLTSDCSRGLNPRRPRIPSTTAVARVVAAESAAAQFEISVGDFEQAAEHYTAGLRFAPDNLGLLLETAYLHLRRSEYSAALDLLDRARRIDPDSPDAAKLAGWAYYGLNRVADAVSEWKRALALKPDAEVQHALEKAERDAQEESSYREGKACTFRLLYNGAAAPELARDVLGHSKPSSTKSLPL